MVADSDSATSEHVTAPAKAAVVAENRFWRIIHGGEDVLLAVALAGILVVPLSLIHI